MVHSEKIPGGAADPGPLLPAPMAEAADTSKQKKMISKYL